MPELLWKRFIEPHDWTKARRLFPAAPWKLYLKPRGTYPRHAWRHFKQTADWVTRTALSRGIRPIPNRLTLRKILTINALLLHGTADAAGTIVRNRLPASVTRSSAVMDAVYAGQNTSFVNPDRLNLSAEGFWPVKRLSIDFVAAYHALARGRNSDRARAQKFSRLLYRSFDHRRRNWRIFYLLKKSAILSRIRQILRWYEKEALRIHRLSSPGVRADEVMALAVKMQRYIDILHIARDGSGRTGHWIGAYVCLQFGYRPIGRVRMTVRGRAIKEENTYLPLSLALRRARLGGIRELQLKAADAKRRPFLAPLKWFTHHSG